MSTSTSTSFINVAPGADFEYRLEDAIQELSVKYEVDEVECFVETARFCLTPVEYDESLAEDMYKMTLRDNESEEKILHEICSTGDIRASFGIDTTFYNFMCRTYQHLSFRHPIVEMIAEEATKIHPTQNWLTAYVSPGTMCLTAYVDGKLQAANCLETMVTENRAYHVLNTWTVLELDVLTDILYIIGIDSEVEKLREAVSNFIKRCE